MAYETCPECGTRKHQLMACPKCGFQRNRIYRDQGTITQKKARKKSELNPLSSIRLDKANKETAPTENMPKSGKDEIVKCPTCSAEIKRKNLKKHIRKLHQSPNQKKKQSRNTYQSKRNISSSSRPRTSGHTTPEHRQAMLAKINQGQYDNERQLLNLLKNAKDRNEDKIINAVHQRLKLIAPETYRKLVGPLHIRDPLGIKKCYCGNPRSLSQIADEIISGSIPEYSLLCDACWDEDICSAWGYYGAWGSKIIDTEIWRSICKERGDTKYATY